MSTDQVRRANLAAIACDPRGAPRAERQRFGRAHRDVLVGGCGRRAVVYPDSDMVWMWTAADAVDIVVERNSGLDATAPWVAEETPATR